MRELKFRVWEVCRGRILRWFFINLNSPIPERSVCIPQLCEEGDMDFNKVYIMQYTGLKDKNGKEIYEGDIVRFKELNFYTEETVKFEDGAFYPFNNDWLHAMLDEAVVIGNIYENPELLNKP